jgi:small GTP-binding protein
MFETDEMSLKLVLLGASDVGKTAFFYRWIYNSFSRLPNPTIGFGRKIVNVIVHDVEPRVDIWDTAGQDQFRMICKIPSRDAEKSIIIKLSKDEEIIDNHDDVSE